MTSYIGTVNKINGATVTVTSEVVGFEKENAFDWNTFDYWKPASSGLVYFTVDFGSAITIDGWSVGFFDLQNNSGTIKPQYSNDNFSTNIVDFDAVETITSGDLIARKTTSVSTRYFRYEINSTGLPSNIGFLWVGTFLSLQRGMTTGFIDPKLARDKKIMNSKSEAGHPLGTSIIQNGLKFNVTQTDVETSWIDLNWNDLADHLEVPNRFIFLWDEENRPDNSVFCWVDGKIKDPTYNNPNLMSFSIPCRGLVS